jgi:hypothetical protein
MLQLSSLPPRAAAEAAMEPFGEEVAPDSACSGRRVSDAGRIAASRWASHRNDLTIIAD